MDQIDLYLGTTYATFYFIGFSYVTLRNKCQFNVQNKGLFILFFIIYGLLMTSVTLELTWVQILLYFEADILITMVLQLAVYRMLTLKLKVEGD